MIQVAGSEIRVQTEISFNKIVARTPTRGLGGIIKQRKKNRNYKQQN